MKSDENVRHGFAGTCAAAQGSQSKKQLLLPNPREELLGSLNGVTMWAGPWIGQETKLKLSILLVGGIMCSVCFWHLRYGSWLVAIFYPVAQNCPNGWCMQLFLVTYSFLVGFPGGTSGKEPVCQCRRHKRPEFSRWVGKIPWRRAWQPSPVFLPRESHGQRSLEGYNP